MGNRPLLWLMAAILACALPAQGSIIVYGSHTTHSIVPGGSISDVRMEVSLSVSGSVATFTFTNASTGLETSAVFKEIVIDRYDGDTGLAILWNGVVVTDTPQVAYTLDDSNGLPGYGALTVETPPLAELQAKPSPVAKGIGIGEALVVQFDTSLPGGSDIIDYLSAFNGGDDTALAAFGFHAISASTVNGESLSGIVTGGQIPDPATASLLVAGGAAFLLRRRRR